MSAAARALEAARELQRLGHAGKAVTLLERVLAVDPRADEAGLAAAQLWQDLGLPGRAQALLRAALKRRPRWAEARLRLGFAHLEARRFESALKEAERAARRHPAPARAWALVARLRSWRGEYAAARVAADAALARDPDEREALRVRAALAVLTGDPQAEAALASLEAALPKDPEAALWRAESLWRAGRALEARTAVEAALRYGSEAVGAHALRALCLLDLGDPLWVSEWKRVADEVPGVFAGRERRIYDAKDPARERAALVTLLEDLRGNRGHPATRLRGSGAARRLRVANPPRAGFFDAPRQAAKRAQTLLRGGDPALVERVFEALLDTALPQGARALVHCYRGEVFLWLGDLDRAQADFERAVALRRRTKWAYVGLCGVHTLRRAYDEALRQARIAARYGAGSVLTWRGEALRRSGRPRAAAADLGRAVELHPHRLGALINLALAKADLGEHAAAAALAARVRELAPALWRDAAGAADPADGAARRAALEACLGALRGNRSSWADVYFTPEGALRTYG